MMFRSGTNPNKFWILVLALIPAMLMLCRTTCAQGPEDFLLIPEIKMKYLEQYATRLDLSLPQWLAVLEFHLEYKKRYQELRTREIEPWLTKGPNLKNETFADWNKETKKYNDKLKYFRRKMAGFDGELFLSIESILTETQLERMLRVRDHRQRQFAYLHTGNLNRPGWNRGVLDLGDVVHAMTLTGAEVDAIDPLLSEYERRLTHLARQVSEICIDWHADFLREMVRRGFGDDEMGVHPAASEVLHDLWSAPDGRRLVRLAGQIDALTHAIARAIEQTFSDERREDWVDEYIRAGYGNCAFIRQYRRQVLKSIEHIGHLNEAEKDFLDASFAEYERRMRDLLDRNVKVTDEYFAPRNSGHDKALWEKAITVWNARSGESYAIKKWFHAQLQQGLTPEAFGRFDEMHALLEAEKDWLPQHASGQSVQMLYDAPLCLSIRDLDQALDRIDIDDEKQTAIDKLMEAYQRECSTKETQQLEATSYTDGPLEKQRIVRTLRRDSDLIEALKQILDSDDAKRMLDWVVSVRHRQQYARNLTGGGVIDPVTFLFDAELTTEQLLGLAPLIDAYNVEVNPLYRERYDSAVRYMRENPGEYFMFYVDDAISEINRRIAIMNDKAMRSMTATLPERLSTPILYTFLRTNHPYVYQDASSLHHFFLRPTLRESITKDQRWQIDNLQADYISQYADFTYAMVALVIDADNWMGGYSGESHLVPIRNGSIIDGYTTLHIQRDDLNAATNVRIRTILPPQQIRAGGGLPELK